MLLPGSHPFPAIERIGSSIAGICNDEEFQDVFVNLKCVYTQFITAGDFSAEIPDGYRVVGYMKYGTNDFPSLAICNITGVVCETKKSCIKDWRSQYRFPPGFLKRLGVDL